MEGFRGLQKMFSSISGGRREGSCAYSILSPRMRLFTGKRARAGGAAGPLRQSNHLLAKSCSPADRLQDSIPARDRPGIRSSLAAVSQEGSGSPLPLL